MGAYLALALMITGMALAGCTSDPNAPVNQSFPIRQMDQFFGSRSPSQVPEPEDYTREPGYAPAYPAYQ
jgi:hypothetical protein